MFRFLIGSRYHSTPFTDGAFEAKSAFTRFDDAGVAPLGENVAATIASTVPAQSQAPSTIATTFTTQSQRFGLDAIEETSRAVQEQRPCLNADCSHVANSLPGKVVSGSRTNAARPLRTKC